MTATAHSKYVAALIPAAHLTGSVSLLLFGLFLLFGAWPILDLGFPETGAMGWNAALSALFFIQHSGMVRRGLRARMCGYLPDYTHRAVYTILSGIVLTLVVLLWQPADTILLELHGFGRWLARGIFVLSLAGFAWTSRALQSFDAFGAEDLKARLQGRRLKPQPFTIRGPYRWVRHPFYFFTLLLIWSCPDLTTDRLVFNVLWSIWIYCGALWEERDLVADYQDQYRRYQQVVPMLIPWPAPGRKESDNR
jgi:protein-S-isoprenylcysteine O-methyltransferase Ste14